MIKATFQYLCPITMLGFAGLLLSTLFQCSTASSVTEIPYTPVTPQKAGHPIYQESHLLVETAAFKNSSGPHDRLFERYRLRQTVEFYITDAIKQELRRFGCHPEEGRVSLYTTINRLEYVSGSQSSGSPNNINRLTQNQFNEVNPTESKANISGFGGSPSSVTQTQNAQNHDRIEIEIAFRLVAPPKDNQPDTSKQPGTSKKPGTHNQILYQGIFQASGVIISTPDQDFPALLSQCILSFLTNDTVVESLTEHKHLLSEPSAVSVSAASPSSLNDSDHPGGSPHEPTSAAVANQNKTEAKNIDKESGVLTDQRLETSKETTVPEASIATSIEQKIAIIETYFKQGIIPEAVRNHAITAIRNQKEPKVLQALLLGTIDLDLFLQLYDLSE